MSEIKIKNISKSFGDLHVLKDISFTVEEGKLCTLLGSSGCGKTTILRIIAGLEFPDMGNILINDKDVTSIPAEKRKIGIVFQNYALFTHMTVFNNVAYGLKIRKVQKEEIQQRVKQILELVGLQGMESRKVTKLSGGQQQRVALARALVIEPNILLLDEPLSALDRKIRAEMQFELRRIQKQIGITAIFVTHDQEEAMSMSDQVLLMREGAIEQMATPERMYNAPVSIYASDFLGNINNLTGTLCCEDEKWAICGKGWKFPVPHKDGLSDGQRVAMAVRSEQMQLSDVQQDGSNPIEITNIIFTGALCRISAMLGEDEIVITLINIAAETLKIGQHMFINIAPDKIHYFASE